MNDLKKNEDEKISNAYRRGTFIGIGVALGFVYGLLFHNVAIVGICTGIAVGVVIEIRKINQNKKQQ